MKFNQAKWERIQRQRESMHAEYRRLDDEWEAYRDNASKIESVFVSRHMHYWDNQARSVFNADNQLTAAGLADRINAIKNRWTEIKDEFGFRRESSGVQSALLQVYSARLEAKKLYELREQQSEKNKAFGASMERLKEFAKRHAKVSDYAANPVPDDTAYSGGGGGGADDAAAYAGPDGQWGAA